MFISRCAEGPGREILNVRLSVCLSVTFSFRTTVYLRVLVEEFIPEQNTTQTIRLIHG